ncbi:hypothetical protein MKW92_037909 [Papaver armeniacum]|nr:hypothetical protein MKW92_037909 [Papaver armeniacum]
MHNNSGFKSRGAREYRYQWSILLGNLFETINRTVRRLEHSPFYYTEILKPLNGLICFVNRRQASVGILNPSTRESTWGISSSLYKDKSYDFAKENERGLWVPTYFFGFDPATKRHKVLCTWSVRNNPRINICEVLTVGENNWRRIDTEMSFDGRVKVSVYADGFIYWGYYSTGVPKFLNAFDVGREKFKVIKVPRKIREKCMNPPERQHFDSINSLIEFGGHVALLQRWTRADRIIIESNPSHCRSDINKVSLYAYDCEQKTSTGKVKSGVVSKLVSASLYSKLESVSLISSFAESLWPVRKCRFRHNQDIEEVRLRLNLDVTAARYSAPAPAPIESFTDLCLHESIMKDIAFHEYTRPTSIQAQAMPVALNGRDLLGCAETGSGKTASFVIPMIQHCLAKPSVRRGDGPLALVLSPTREHAQQIEKEVKAFSRSLEYFRTAIAVGGTNMAEQRSELRAGVNIVVATPGSFLDHLQQGNTCLSRISFVVLDEADRMLDMGFELQIREVQIRT